ncbi:helix-turn-helix domain-containing protein [Actinoplanes friuliensis]|uniref:XRE family transcriptional regulator n=1 Tax=Actinoplanes friuliensis DSM 7358 TaxID=1246995 RepID=U5W9E1_9ACTN|nr:helix-turn-helix transcriptional regulator [Actinoplanes friuliensis]AGZ45764.1 XRE family transcriptional regulator [Actinoplanes friuliensis DSM 7358]
MAGLLGDFLKARRALLLPGDVGLPGYGRRRVAGLRRDELAGLAGVSAHYLMRLEQGRDRHPSPQVLDALARALRLDADTTAHLHALAQPPAFPPPRPLDPAVQRLLDDWAGTPAYVRGRHLDVLAGNKLAAALSPMYAAGRNLARDIFLEPEARKLFADWEVIAEQTVAALRAGADPRDPALAALVAELDRDPDFRRWWARHDVRPARDETKRFHHPVVGPLTLRRQALTVAGALDQVIIAYQAEPGSDSAKLLSRLG